MAIKTQIFYIDRGVERAHKLEELLLGLRADSIVDLSVFPAPNGKTQVVVTYEPPVFQLTGSSPPDGQGAVVVSTPVFLTFDEELDPDVDLAVAALSAFRNGIPVTISAGDLTVSDNRLTIVGLVDATAAAYYQLVITGNLRSSSGLTLGRDTSVTWFTA